MSRDDARAALDLALNRLFMRGVGLVQVVCGHGTGEQILAHPLVESCGLGIDRASYAVTLCNREKE